MAQLSSLNDPIELGSPAPAFELPEVRGGLVRLSDVLRTGRAALVFYRGGWCPICNRQLARLSERYDEFRSRRTEIVAISNDIPRAGAVAGIGPEFPVVYDGVGTVLAAYGLIAYRRDPLGWLLAKRGYAHPAVVVVRSDGRVEWVYRGASYRDRPTPDRILAAIDVQRGLDAVGGPAANHAQR